MTSRSVLVIVAIAASTASAQSPQLTGPELEPALAAAKQDRFQSLFVEARGRFGADFSLLLQGPIGRTMDLAREAFESYKPFAPPNVPAQVRARELTLAVMTHSGVRRSVRNVVIMPAGATSRDAAIQPLPGRGRSLDGALWRDVRPRTWRPGLGSEPSGLPLFYRFAEADLPPGDLQIIVATEAGDERYMVRAQERDRIR
jgi:hypothetical protein